MAQEFNPIDKKSLIIYSLILLVVIVVAAIIIKNPQKKTTVVKTVVPETVVSLGTTEPNGYKIKGGWQIYKGATFDINYPNGYTPKVLSSKEVVSFTSADGQRILTVYGPLAPGATPSEFVLDAKTETVVNSMSGKNPNCNNLICSREITIVKATNESYMKKILVSKNDSDKTTAAFAIQYQPGIPDQTITDIFNNLQESLAKHAK